MNSPELKSKARELGADLIGIAPISRLDHLPPGSNPKSILPQVQSVVVVGRRILRGAFRGVEEGTNFHSTYQTFGAGWQEMQFLGKTIYELVCFLERTGAEAVPLSGGAPAGEQTLIGNTNVPANVALDYKGIAQAAGLGSVGKGGFFLTKEYGHRQRFGLILTDMTLEADPVSELDLCAGCAACLKACPLGAIRDSGKALFDIDRKFCEVCTNGVVHSGPLASDSLDRHAAACGRACLVALENKIGNRFQNKFRKRLVWERDLSGKARVKAM